MTGFSQGSKRMGRSPKGDPGWQRPSLFSAPISRKTHQRFFRIHTPEALARKTTAFPTKQAGLGPVRMHEDRLDLDKPFPDSASSWQAMAFHSWMPAKAARALVASCRRQPL